MSLYIGYMRISMSNVEVLTAVAFVWFILFLLIHAWMYKLEETRAWNRKRVLERRVKRDTGENKKDS